MVIALVAAVTGFSGIAAGAVDITKILFFVFIVIAVITFIMSLIKNDSDPPSKLIKGEIMRILKTTQIATLAAVLGVAAIATTGCSVARNQQTVGSYVDDSGITTAVKAKFAEDKTVSATSISVETLKGEVQLSGFAKSQAEKDRAGAIARDTKGVTGVRNSIVVRP